jgi:hypothetical protein
VLEPETNPGRIRLSQKEESECDGRYFRKIEQGQEVIVFDWIALIGFLKIIILAPRKLNYLLIQPLCIKTSTVCK